MLLSVPVAAARIHEPVSAAALADGHWASSSATPASTASGGAPSSAAPQQHQHHQVPRHHNNSPARRVMRAVLSFTRQRQQQQQKEQQARGGPRPKAPAHRGGVVAVAASAAASAAAMPPPLPGPSGREASSAALQQQQEHLLHSAASLTGPAHEHAQDVQKHHHRRRRGDADHNSVVEAAAAAAAAGATEAAAAGAAAAAAAAAATSAERPTAARATATAASSSSHSAKQHNNNNNNNNNHNPLRALLRFVVHHAHRAARAARPHGPGLNDATPIERCVNVLTSLPFLAVGLHVLRTRRAGAARRFGRSFVAVGLAAGAYHACPRRHPLRRPLRLLDYYSIAWSSSLLREAVGVKLPRWAALAAACVTPVKPTAVTAGNLAAIELAFARAALGGGSGTATACPTDMRRAWRRHLVAAGAGLSCFLAEDAVLESGRVNFNAFHGVWHLLSAAALGLANALLGHVEQALLIEAAEVVAEGQV